MFRRIYCVRLRTAAWVPLFSECGFYTAADRRNPPEASNHLEKTRGAHAPSDAHGDDDVLRAAALALYQCVAGEPRSGHAVGVAEGDRAAVDVQALVRDAEPVAAVDHLHRERLVQLPQADVLHPQARARKQSRHREHRADAHFVRLAAGDREAAEDPERLQVALFGELRIHHDAGGGAVGELARVPGRDRAAFDRRLDLGDTFERRVGADAFVPLFRDFLDPAFPRVLVGFLRAHGDRKNLLLEPAAGLGGRCALLALHAGLVLALAADVVALGGDFPGLET